MTVEDTSPYRKGRLPDENDTIIQKIILGLTSTAPLRRSNLHGSDASYCPRKNSLMLNMPEGQMVETGAASQFYFSIGSAVHETIQRGLENAGMLIAKEFRMNSLGIKIGGYVDAIIRYDGSPRILEIKTCGALPAKPKPEHVFQALTYSLVTGIPDPIVFYASRSVANWDGKLITKQFDLESTRESLYRVAIGMYRSLYYSKAQRLADIPAHIESERDCGFCPFSTQCWRDHGGFHLTRASTSERDLIEADAKRDAIALTKKSLGFPNTQSDETAKVLKEMKGVDLYS